MRPELIENPTFLRYYEKWQKDPTSVVFAAISEIFRANGMVEDAIKIAKEGLKHHPELISGQLALAKAYLANGEMLLARRYAASVIEKVPNNEDARKILTANGHRLPDISETVAMGREPMLATAFDEEEVTEDMPIALVDDEEEVEEVALPADGLPTTVAEEASDGEAGSPGSIMDSDAWHTITMADILKRQGHFDRARRIYKKILEREPDNKEAMEALRD